MPDRDDLRHHVLAALLVAQTYRPILARNGGGALVNTLSVFPWASGAVARPP